MYPMPGPDDITWAVFKSFCDEDFKPIIEWGRHNELPQWSLLLFCFDKKHHSFDPNFFINRAVAGYIKSKDSLIPALKDAALLLETADQWQCFTFALKLAAWWNLADASVVKREDVIRQQILEKTREIVRLAKELDETAGHRLIGPSKQVYPVLLTKAEEIHNQAVLGQYREGIPGLYPDDECTFSEYVAPQLNNEFWDWDHYPLPSIESLILAYGDEMAKTDEDYGYFNPIKFSKRRSPGDFIRFLTQHWLHMINAGRLPESIKDISLASIERFANVHYSPYVIRATNYIDKEWQPITNK